MLAKLFYNSPKGLYPRKKFKLDAFCTENNKNVCLLYGISLYLHSNKYISNKYHHK